MKAAVTSEQHGFDIVDMPDPTPASDELVIRVAACGICGSDIKAQPLMPARGDGPRVRRGARVHGLRHTCATELANSNISVHTLMKLLGHESMATSQRYVAGAASPTGSTTASSPTKNCWERTIREMRSLMRSEDAKKGPLAFAEKREPVWKARYRARMFTPVRNTVGSSAHAGTMARRAAAGVLANTNARVSSR